MAKYDKKSQEKVKKVMHEIKQGTLKSGSGKKVKSKKQAIAIGLSEARREGSKAPRKKTASRAQRGPVKRKKSPVGKKSVRKKKSTSKSGK